jgi:tRNA(Ile)-lysidine synthase
LQLSAAAPGKTDLPQAAFNAAMEDLRPFGTAPRFAVAVSGGADSTALALLAQDWAARHEASIIALIVDHGLRSSAPAEAERTRTLLAERGIEARILTLSGLPSGAKLQEGARIARYAALGRAARAAGALFLLLGHHRADQSETVAMRAARGTGGLQGMATFSARNDVVLLRPLLAISPATLRAFLRAAKMSWIEDPSNADPRFERVRIRRAGTAAIPEAPTTRQRREAEAAAFLGRHAEIRPQGFAILRAGTAPPAALAALLRIIGGATYAPRLDRVAALGAKLRPATLGGVRIMPAGKHGPGWLLVRESAACAPPVDAVQGAVWDGRFRLAEPGGAASFGGLGPDAPKFRHGSNLPAAVLRGLPCIRPAGDLMDLRLATAIFAPPGPAAPHPFLAASAGPEPGC